MISARTSAPHGALAAGIWRIADPKITLASVASMIVGAAAAALAGPIAWRWLAATVLGIFAIEAAKNASGEIFDWDSGADTGVAEDERSPFSGGKRVIVDGLLTRRQTAWVALVAYAIGAAIGLAIAIEREPAVVWLGLLGVALAYFYHAPPLALAYRGLGELAVALAYGPVIAAGTYLVQRHTVDRLVLAPAVPLGLAIGAFLWVNEFPDARADAAAGKRTLVVRLGRRRAARAFSWLVAAAYAAVVALPLLGLPWSTLGGLVGLPLAIRAAARLRRFPETPAEQIPAQAATLGSFVAMALGLGVGLLAARWL
ncbi:MAG: prenyltransferase [Kofleriaceae bacterium]|nr:prenyltransferase [Kofleriaceae bacterium]MBP9170818.1 prenyltransferase [Kofleriaceae bacterium]MBP9857667.1 prenyltransferase [Kofleriaceae bacterium]